MRSDHETGEFSQLKQILETSWQQAREQAGQGGHEAWPQEWSGEPESARAGRDLREGLLRGRVSGGARWEVPLRAAIAVALLALGVVAVVAVLVMRMDDEGTQGVTIGESAPLISTSAPTAGSGQAVDPVPAAVAADPPGAARYRVYVVGQVRDPGVVALAPDARVQDAIKAAGGATGKADLTRINLARKVVDGERLLVPKPGEEVPAEPLAGSDPGSGGGGAGGSPVDLNSATVGELDALPGVGPVLAGRIVEWRDQNGRFGTVDDLNEVSGIGDTTMEKLRPLVRV
ncbi:helix-hairpin-helix domain-containing protein [Kineosporia sp. J2-2]|uniref:Helix-hairpin-helix domain-containing protein n=1 Tax=Kineosporia corallincola TaxID=2835133 RepID=A0ABS5TKB2_9ACTN|nr:helix-hairpin-helix domain-containing protein [Kineosporia corallincola]MBT0770819.1 helix-hairpin-helix domain-containing protein [Kineosporia corallincola]